MQSENKDIDKLFWGLMCLGVAVIIAMVVLSGCDSQTSKPEANPDTSHDAETETDNTVTAGDNSIVELQEIITNVQKTMNEILQITMQSQKSASTNAEKIESLVNNINNTNNSSWLMFGIVVIVMGGCVSLIIVLMKMKIRIERAIASPHNTLTKDQYKSL